MDKQAKAHEEKVRKEEAEKLKAELKKKQE